MSLGKLPQRSQRFTSRHDACGTEISVSDAEEVQNACCWTSWLSLYLSLSRDSFKGPKEMKFTWHKVLTVARMRQQLSTNS